MPLPAFREDKWLPEGHHPATWEEIIAVFGGELGSKRARVLANLLDWRNRLREKGVTGQLILNGSFISAKPEPGDFDTILILDEGKETVFAHDEEANQLINYAYCKQQRWGDIFVFSTVAVQKFPQMCRLDGFDYDKITKTPKGVVEVAL